MSDCRFGISLVNYPDPDPDENTATSFHFWLEFDETQASVLIWIFTSDFL